MLLFTRDSPTDVIETFQAEPAAAGLPCQIWASCDPSKCPLVLYQIYNLTVSTDASHLRRYFPMLCPRSFSVRRGFAPPNPEDQNGNFPRLLVFLCSETNVAVAGTDSHHTFHPSSTSSNRIFLIFGYYYGTPANPRSVYLFGSIVHILSYS